MGRLRAGAFRIVPGVEGFVGGRVLLEGDRVVSPDVVIAATGYRPGLEPLVGHLGPVASRASRGPPPIRPCRTCTSPASRTRSPARCALRSESAAIARAVGSPLMPPSDRLLGFVLTAFVLIVIPGPTVLFVVSRGVALGRRAALATVAGNAGGVLVQVVLVALGLGALVERSDAVFTVIKLAGAVYLVVLGVRMIRHRKELGQLADATEAPRGTRTIVREGFIVGLTNPKAAVILTVVLPQFADPARGHVPLQLAFLGGLFLLIGVISDSAWAIAAGSARVWLARSRRRLEALTGAGGVVLIGLGLRLALTGRHD